MQTTAVILASLAALAQPTPPVPASPQAPCAQAVRWGLDVAVAEICAGDDANQLAAKSADASARTRLWTQAADHFRRAASASGLFDAQRLALTLLAECFDRQHLNDPAGLESALRELIRLVPDDLSTVARLAQLQEDEGLLEAAESTLLEARRTHAEAVDPYKWLAQFYARRATSLSKSVTAQNAGPTSGPGEPDAAGVYRVGGGLTPPPRLDVPQYPPEARAAGIKGAVLAEVLIDPTGRVSDARVVQSIPLLDDAALKAVRAWQFAPTVVNGQAVPVRMTVTVNFSLPPERPGPPTPGR